MKYMFFNIVPLKGSVSFNNSIISVAAHMRQYRFGISIVCYTADALIIQKTALALSQPALMPYQRRSVLTISTKMKLNLEKNLCMTLASIGGQFREKNQTPIIMCYCTFNCSNKAFNDGGGGNVTAAGIFYFSPALQ